MFDGVVCFAVFAILLALSYVQLETLAFAASPSSAPSPRWAFSGMLVASRVSTCSKVVEWLDR